MRLIILLFFINILPLLAETSRNPEGVFVEQKLGQKAQLDLVFLNEQGNKVTIRELVQDKVVIIAPSYYECPRLCTLVYNGLRKVIENTKDIIPGKDYKIISLSFSPEDDYKKAHKKGEAYRNSFKNHIFNQEDWIFLVIDPFPENQNNAKILLESLGYHYKQDGKDFSHPASIIFLTKEGIISKYLYGIEFLPRDFRFAIIEASEGKVGTPIDTIIMSCFRYDSIQGKYAPFAWGFIRLGGILILVFILGMITILIFFDKKFKIHKI